MSFYILTLPLKTVKIPFSIRKVTVLCYILGKFFPVDVINQDDEIPR